MSFVVSLSAATEYWPVRGNWCRRLWKIHAERGPQERRTRHSAKETRRQESASARSFTTGSTQPQPRSPHSITTMCYYVKNSTIAANSSLCKSTAWPSMPHDGHTQMLRPNCSARAIG